MELELHVLPRKDKDGSRVADDAQEAKDGQEHDLEHELHGLLELLVLLRLFSSPAKLVHRLVHDHVLFRHDVKIIFKLTRLKSSHFDASFIRPVL